MVVTVYGVTVSWICVVVVLMEIFVETGSSPVEMFCHSLELVMILLKPVELRLLTYVVPLHSLQVEYIDVIWMRRLHGCAYLGTCAREHFFRRFFRKRL